MCQTHERVLRDGQGDTNTPLTSVSFLPLGSRSVPAEAPSSPSRGVCRATSRVSWKKRWTPRKEIASLTQERKEVLLTPSQIPSPRNRMRDERNCTGLQGLLQTKYQCDSLIKDRKALLAELDKEILELEKKMARQNRAAVKAKQANSSNQLQKQIETLELHLNNVTVHFHTILSRNKELREEIEKLQIQKALLGKLSLKLHKKLAQQRRRMNSAAEQCTQGYKQRMGALARIAALNKRHIEDTVQRNVELQEQKRALEKENKLKNFMLTKCRDRSELEEVAKKRKALKAAQWAKQSQMESFESQEVAYRRLLELAEDGNFDRLVDNLIEKEGKNFASFIYITELKNEMEKMKQRIKDVQDEITTLMMDREDAETGNFHVLQELEEKLAETTREANWCEERCKESSRVLGQIKCGVEALLEVIGGDATKTTEQLGENGQITDGNLTRILGLVEKETNELLLMESVLRYTRAEGSQPAQPFASPLLGTTSLPWVMDRARLCPPPPALDSTPADIAAWEVPLGHGQLHQLVLQSCEKELGHAAAAAKKGSKSLKE
ncbi:coiled-coil domain-containing protein 63-like isoform X1 [Falco cherrug]|uniref:coiled-coil domain-containing protein 63-like isoform X1 n=1 Tax=Falco cherrug TaxID=345164 RepID=UPI00247A964F|nr:coiled-coil domain-containing protein 63-like isoform X1 [Falco cherrug]